MHAAIIIISRDKVIASTNPRKNMSSPSDTPADAMVASSGQTLEYPIPDKFRRLSKLLEAHEWKLVRITGSHYIFEKPGKRCIPVAFHGGSISRRYAEMVVQQAGLLTNTNASDVSLPFESLSLEEEEACLAIRVANRETAQQKPRDLENRDPTVRVRMPAQKPLSCVGEHEKQILVHLQHKKEQERADMFTRQRIILKDIRNAMKVGDYDSALEKVHDEKVDVVGSSDSGFNFTEALLHSKIDALANLALQKHALGSKAQHHYIRQAIEASVLYSENYPERRPAVRALFSNCKAALSRTSIARM